VSTTATEIVKSTEYDEENEREKASKLTVHRIDRHRFSDKMSREDVRYRQRLSPELVRMDYVLEHQLLLLVLPENRTPLSFTLAPSKGQTCILTLQRTNIPLVSLVLLSVVVLSS
jgi:hypothetical protein